MKNRLKQLKRHKQLKLKRRFRSPECQLNACAPATLPIFLQKKGLFSLLIVSIACFFVFLPQNDIDELHYYLYAGSKKPTRGCLPGPYSSFKNSENAECLPTPIAKNGPLRDMVVSIVKHTPMEKMVDAIAERETKVVAYLVGIAMKESKFGIYSPKKDGAECYNYWGYRGKENTTASGYSCFDSPEHAIKVVGDRIESMVKRGARNPAEMISWKCGSTCAGHDPESVRKWIADVSIHYHQISSSEQIAKNK
ncbi:hypothetical protein HGA34_01515 [Candidatus Falkowbacteria bacterium]|nr:hypothetical protein [Candidatus Falkowbacteria bacterium]